MMRGKVYTRDRLIADRGIGIYSLYEVFLAVLRVSDFPSRRKLPHLFRSKIPPRTSSLPEDYKHVIITVLDSEVWSFMRIFLRRYLKNWSKLND